MKRKEENYAEFFKKVNSMYLDCEKKKTLQYYTLQVQSTQKCSDLVNKMQINPVVSSNLDTMCCDTEPKINEEVI